MGYIAFILMIINVLSKAMGFFRDVLLSYYYGTGEVATAFQIAFAIPYTILGFVIQGFSVNFIPTYTSIKNKNGRKYADKFTNNLVNLILIISIFATLLAFIFARQIVFLFAMGYSGEIFELSVTFTRITILGMFAQLLNSVFKGYLNVYGDFVVPGSTGFLYNAIIILFLILSNKLGTVYAPIGVALGTVFQYLPYIPALRKVGYKHRPILKLNDKNVKRLLILALPVVLGVAVNQINHIIDKNLASFISEKGISVLTYSLRLYEFVWGIMIVSVTTSIFPTLSRLALTSIPKFKSEITKTIGTILYLVVPASVGMMVFSKEIITLIYRRGKFDESDVLIVSGILFYYSLGLIGLGARDVLSGSFYSLKMTKIPLINSIEMVAINIVLSVLLSRFMGLNGLALGSTIASLFGALNLFFKLKGKIGEFKYKRFLNNLIKIIISTVFMIVFSKFIFVVLSVKLSSNLSFLIALIFAGFSYALVSVMLRTEQALSILRVIINKIDRKS